MAEEIVYDNEYATIWVDVENKIVHHQMKKWLKGQPIRDLLDQGYINSWLTITVPNGSPMIGPIWSYRQKMKPGPKKTGSHGALRPVGDIGRL